MNGIDKYLVDTNVFIHLLNGNSNAKRILFGNELTISFITELELQSKKGLSPEKYLEIKNLISDCFVFDINEEIKLTAIDIRRNSSLKLPDSIIAATSIFLKRPLVTNDRDFSLINGLDVVIFTP